MKYIPLIWLAKIKITFHTFKKNQSGVTAIEYSLIALAITALVVVALFYNGGSVISAYTEKFTQLADLVQKALTDS
ncbi:Flp family type IVb pilin [Testudinibacter sp. P80/BLE/0925]|uniref:Flp family type IVb pilin n=1 Tax=Testudinibacter sp. TW-1 TaxID=3417757 RepID=UPI003D361CB5